MPAEMTGSHVPLQRNGHLGSTTCGPRYTWGMATKVKFPVPNFPIRGAVLSPAKRAAAVRSAVANVKLSKGERPTRAEAGQGNSKPPDRKR